MAASDQAETGERRAPNYFELRAQRMADLEVSIKVAEQRERRLLRAVRAGGGGEESHAAFHAAQLQRRLRDAFLEELFLLRRLDALGETQFILHAEIIRSGAV